MSTSTCSTSLRVLLCGRCGAPLEAPVAGGTVACRYCQAQNAFPARARATHADEARGAPGPAANDPARLARLAAQQYAVARIPASLEALLFAEGRFLQPARVGDAWSTLQAALVRSRQGDALAAEELVVLAAAFFEALRAEPWKRRAAVESSLDALTLDRHRAALHGLLARGAASEGDFASARAWCAEIPARSDELAVDSEHRVSAAFIVAAEGRPGEILPLLGPSSQHVPIATRLRPLADSLRAHGAEAAGQMDAAMALLGAHTRGLRTTLDLDELRVAWPRPELAPRAYRALAASITERQGSAVGRRWRAILLPVIATFGPIVPILIIGGGFWSTWITAPLALVMIAVPATIATLLDARRMKRQLRLIHEGTAGRLFMAGLTDRTSPLGAFGSGGEILVRTPDGTLHRHDPIKPVAIDVASLVQEQVVARMHPEVPGLFWYDCGDVTDARSPYRRP